jgi:hypothetical protein
VDEEMSLPRRRWREGEYEYGRIRLYAHTSWLVRQILHKERLRLFVERRAAKDLGSSVTTWNRQIAQVTQVLEEIDRLRNEKGWLDGEPERRDKETTSPELSTKEARAVG